MTDSQSVGQMSCSECQQRLERYLSRTLRADETLGIQQHLMWCDVCRESAFLRARERVVTGEEPLRAPPRTILERVAAFVSGVLEPRWFPQFYFDRPVLAGALDDRPRIHATPDRQFLVELTPFSAEVPEEQPTLEIAIRAHSPELSGSRVQYRIFESEATEPCHAGEAVLDEDGVAIVHVPLPRTSRAPYRFEVEAALPDESENEPGQGSDI